MFNQNKEQNKRSAAVAGGAGVGLAGVAGAALALKRRRAPKLPTVTQVRKVPGALGAPRPAGALPAPRSFSGEGGKYKGKSGYALKRGSDGRKRWYRVSKDNRQILGHAAMGAATGAGISHVANAMARAGGKMPTSNNAAAAIGSGIVGALGAKGMQNIRDLEAKNRDGRTGSTKSAIKNGVMGYYAGQARGMTVGGAQGAAIGGAAGVLSGAALGTGSKGRLIGAGVNGAMGAVGGAGIGRMIGGVRGSFEGAGRGIAAGRGGTGKSEGKQASLMAPGRGQEIKEDFKDNMKNSFYFGNLPMSAVQGLRSKARKEGNLEEFRRQEVAARKDAVRNQLIGGGTGAATGALIGGLAGRSGTAALVGGALGAAGGSIGGNVTTLGNAARRAKEANARKGK